MTKRLVALAALAALCIAALALAGAAGASAFSSVAAGSCGTFAGPAWKVVRPSDGATRKGTLWRVEARGVTCSYAKTTAKALARRTPLKGAPRMIKGPKGWTCIAGVDRNAIAGGGGYCQKGSRSFSWVPTVSVAWWRA